MILVNQLAKQTCVPIHTIRYYERYGLFRGKKNGSIKSNNYSYYDDEVIQKLHLIKEAKEIGFTLNEIKQLIDAWYSNRLSVERKKEILEKKMTEIDEKIKQLKDVRKLLSRGLVDIDAGEC